MNSIPFSSIIEGTRARNTNKYGDVTGLAESLKTLGTIHPIVLSRSNGTLTLVAGGRRYRAMQTLGIKELYHGSTLDPERLGYVFADEVPESVRKEAELDENLHRLDVDWIDNVLLIADIHELNKAKNLKWGHRQTAALLGKGYSRQSVGQALKVAKCLRAGDKEIQKCDTMMEALTILTKRKEDEALAELQRRANEKLGKKIELAGANAPGSTASFLDKLNITFKKTPLPKPGETPAPETPALVEPPIVSVPFSYMFRLGDFRDVLSDSSFKVDHIVTDIPYGISMDNLNNVEDVRAEHDVEQNVSMMKDFLILAYHITKPHGFCVFFYDLDHHEKLQTWAKAAGWKVQRWPYIAAKTSPCQNNAAQYNTTKNYECAMFLRKDEHTVLRKTISTSWKPYNFQAEAALYNNPFAKPFELWKDIYDAIAFPTQTVLDPFCGEMSACRAAANCGLTPFGVEINEKHFNRGLEMMRGVYAVIHKNNVEFV